MDTDYILSNSSRIVQLSIPVRVPTSNELRQLNYREYAALRHSLKAQLAASLSSNRELITNPFKHCIVYICRHSPKPARSDIDGLVGGIKPLLDCFIRYHKTRAPSGLSIIHDDSRECLMDLAVFSHKSSEVKTDIVILEYVNPKFIKDFFSEIENKKNLIF